MHGRLKVKDTAEKAAEKALEREKKRKKYLAGIQSLFDQRESGYKHAEALQSSALLLIVNPDALTLWNIRREILLQLSHAYRQTAKEAQNSQEERGQNCDGEEMNVENIVPALGSMSCTSSVASEDLKALPATWLELISAELAVISSCLQANPKSYGAWHHRLWLMEQLCSAASADQAQSAWKEELALCDLFLTKDERNFHCWDYRRAVVEHSNVDAVEELQFSLSLIERNFSNFSAWHYRSKLLPLLHPASSASPLPVDEKIFSKELKRVVEAVFTDPGDQSPWFFLRWLLHQQSRQPQFVQVAVCQATGNVRVVCNFTSPVQQSFVQRHLVLPNSTETVWRSASSQPCDCVWFTEIEDGSNSDLRVEANGSVFMVPVTCGNCTSITLGRIISPIPASTTSFVLHQLLQDCNLLHEIDPDNKWVLLSLVELLCALGAEDDFARAITILGHLCTVDPLRTGYYTDRKSSLVLREKVAKYVKTASSMEVDAELDCSGLGLSRIDCPYLLACIPRINFSNNLLTSLSGAGRLLACSSLILDGNPIDDFKPLRRMMGLCELSLANCGLRSSHVLDPLTPLQSLRRLNVKCNEFDQDQSLRIRELFGHVLSLEL